MTALVSYPFRFDGAGRVATVEQGTDEASAEQIAALLLTRTGERDLSPDFGVTDMTGQGVDESEIAAAIAAFGPDVELDSVEITSTTETALAVAVTFE